MTFHHPAFLLLLLLTPVPWIYWRTTPGCSRVSLLFKCAAFGALVVALADPWVSLPSRKLAVTMVMEASAGASKDSLQKGESFFRELARKNWGAELRLITVSDQADGGARAAGLPLAPAIPGSMTSVADLESGLQLALGTIPQPGAGRILLFTNGNESRGHVLNAALQARQMGVPVSVTPLTDGSQSSVEVQSVRFPQRVFSGERFTVSLELTSSRAVAAQISALCQGQQIGMASVHLQAGANPIHMEMRIHGQGTTLVELRLHSGGSEQVLLSRAISISRLKVLYVSGATQASEPLLQTLKSADVDVDVRTQLPARLRAKEWDSVVLDNFPERQLSAVEAEDVESYVRGGGGLVEISGEHTPDLLRNPKAPLARLLPVREAPEDPDRSLSVVLVLDRSGSMTGEKIQKAREAARASLLTLRPTDRVGIIAFNDKFHWVAPLQTASDIPRLVRLVESISADGSTRIYPPLKAAFDEVLGDATSLKHIILLTDGVSEQEGLPQLMLDAAAQHVTISTIGLGSDVLRNMLENLARSTQGHSYFVNAESDLPQVMSGDLQNAKTSLIKEGSVQALRAQPAEMTDGIQWNAAPPLLGFVRTKAKKGAETLVRLKSGEPLLVRWQYGLGHVVAFTSDARGRWAAQWVRWKSFGRLWPQVIRGVSNHDRNVHVDVRPGSNQGEEIVAYDLLNGADGDAATALRRQSQHVILVQSPDNLVQPFALAETRPDHYEAQIAITKPGLYRVFSPQSGDVHLPETGFYYEPEQRKGAANRQLLSQIAELTGGRLSPTAEELLDRRGTLFLQARPVWPYILIAVLILNFFEVAIRRRLFQSRRLRPDRLSPQPAGMAFHPISQPDAMPQRDYFQK